MRFTNSSNIMYIAYNTHNKIFSFFIAIAIVLDEKEL